MRVFVLIGLIALTGCGGIDAVARAASRAVDTYCDTPQQERGAIRAIFASRLAPNKITVECEGDLPE